MILRRLVPIAGLLMLNAGPAVAADLDTTTPTLLKFYNSMPAPIWSGLYIGANAGFSIAADGTANGFVGGLQLGYNYQVGHWVFGIETDFSYNSFLTSSVTSGTSAAWVGSLRPRLGYAMGPLLFYGTGGLAYASPDLSSFFASNADFRLGWTAGVGVEYMVYRNLSLRLEYLHTDLSPSTNTSDHLTDNVVRLGVIFRF